MSSSSAWLPGRRPDGLGRLRWPELDDPRPVLLLPLGSTEQHGPHLPLDTDTRIAKAIAAAVATRLRGLLVAPALHYGASGEHAGFPGTLSLGTAALELALVELVRSADDTAAGVVLINGHGGNAAAIHGATRLLAAEGRRVLAWTPRTVVATAARGSGLAGDLHAGRVETSLLLHLAPELVRLEAAARGPSPTTADLVRHGVLPLSPSGVLGDPAGASADEGAALLDAFVTDAVAAIRSWPGYAQPPGVAPADPAGPWPR
ncbi:mycofactocin biosynthesis peptidyl-dipeptidase MftE [Pseudofrankia sp. BMG5.37]|uniref:mycofactocin biosynthesis peptidyl-dipeptidase MftE n=1 Tax=Pseudofrankia sp. BMG5.37 TaxID=3050035 RepID=UPI002894A0E5|nr:mycofactocin biosynthesis peptidyl-dipeptidase MftE [Pseudofrankia sp. BMG5.37]MDT3445852.1 mycofactocin biosynthesis peptidyl-dipeptidase MftE [Pseudofrankia sp. BMG5.37]